MTAYRAPTRDMWFVLEELVPWREINALPGYEEATPELVRLVLKEAAVLAEEVIAPTNVEGDQEGARLDPAGDPAGTSGVRVPEGFREAFAQFRAGGWSGLGDNPEFGGQGLPELLAVAVSELWQSANLAWSNCSELSHGAARAIEAHASDALKTAYLPHLVDGSWTGTMNLTEPQAGSDLALIRCSAAPEGEHYLITGQKIFITYGDHDMSDNIVHLVLARLPDAPPGVRGISLFLVPKILCDADGSLGPANRVKAVSIEHKLGIHGSPTCVMQYDRAVGYLVGEEHQGLACMFTMMNRARIGVGLQGLSVAERAYQHALGYARERVQGSLPGDNDPVTIIHHPDVRRMLMEMKAQIEAMRAVGYVGASCLDRATHGDVTERSRYQARADLMTPIIKGWITETGQQITSLALQVFGGMGFVEETGAAQHYRDARITTIYEGTTGIQASDLVGRKILRDGGVAIRALIAEMRDLERDVEARLPDQLAAYRTGVDRLESAVDWLLGNAGNDFAAAGAVAVNMLMLCGVVSGAHAMAKSALVAAARLDYVEDDASFFEGKIITARFYNAHILPRAGSYLAAVEAGSDVVMGLTETQFEPAPLR